jgi:hypothetical protein
MFAIAVIGLLLPGLLFLIGIVSMLSFHTRELNTIHQDGICDRCGYNLTGNTSGICPECGLKIGERPG